MKKYKNIIEKVMVHGVPKANRTGVETISYFGIQKRFDLTKGFPLVTGKQMNFSNIAAELLWMLSGNTNNNKLKEFNGSDKPTIWEQWSLSNGELGPIYGAQWRNWDGVIDQITELIETLKTNPNSRRLIVSAWNPKDLPNEQVDPQENVYLGRMALAPCHYSFECWTAPATIYERATYAVNNPRYGVPKNWIYKSTEALVAIVNQLNIPKTKLSLKINQRSCDLFVGVPYNIASYALLTHILAHYTGMIPNTLIWSGGDVHIYSNHFDAVRKYLKQPTYELPFLTMDADCGESIDDLKMGHFTLANYKCGEPIYVPVAK